VDNPTDMAAVLAAEADAGAGVGDGAGAGAGAGADVGTDFVAATDTDIAAAGISTGGACATFKPGLAFRPVGDSGAGLATI
jgi:hypothetical protein